MSSKALIAALGALALMIVMFWSVGGAVAHFIASYSAIEDQKAVVGRLEKSVSVLVEKPEEGGAEIVVSPYLNAKNRSLAAAEMQTKLNEKLAKLGVSSNSTDVQYPKTPEGMPDRLNAVQLKMDVTLSEGELANLLPLLEDTNPVLLVEELVVERTRELRGKPVDPQKWQVLDVAFTVVGFWEADN